MPSRMQAVNEKSTESRFPEAPTSVEVYVDDVDGLEPRWYFAILREWAHFPSHGWTATVQWSRPDEHGDDQHLDRFLAAHVRQDIVDRSHRRDEGYRPDMTTTPQNPNEEPEVETGSAPQPTPDADPDSEPAGASAIDESGGPR